nr:bifunctional diaminohydroxyphosphoribosylaminopyrimidine deaminase/5-amino-6-(5-phosphoribosylamino)uracil reductase RibD [Paenibacillus caui]
MINDEFYMSLALDLAKHTQGQTGINPVVGAVVVKDGAVVGMGAHLRRGEAHAEVHALDMAGERAQGSTVYVSLEPCSHYGATPPCSKRLIEAKVARVVVACVDPNPQVSGRGTRMLREAGIEVVTGVLEKQAKELNKKFIKFITTGLPYVTLKAASTLDGKMASKTGDSKWITNEASRAMVHTLRHQHEGIMVGVDTVIADDPLLTTRLPVPGISPARIVVDSKLRIPVDAGVLKADGAGTIILTTEGHGDSAKLKAIEAGGARVIPCGNNERVDLKLGLQKLGELGISSILVEGGGKLNGSFIAGQLADEVLLFMAPKLIGGMGPGSFVFDGPDSMQEAVRLTNLQVTQIEDDICISGVPQWR